jgi:hypothetical protein
MGTALPRLAAVFGVMAAMSALAATAQEVIRFQGKSAADKPGEAVAASDSPSNKGETSAAKVPNMVNPFVPEDQGAKTDGKKAPADLAQPSCGKTDRRFTIDRLFSRRNCCGPDCEECPKYGLALAAGMESWRNPSNSVRLPNLNLPLQANTGIVSSANFGVPIPKLQDYGVGFQLGVSYGMYNFDGQFNINRADGTSSSEVQQQVFVTTGFFRRAFEGSPISAGLVYDWQTNDGYGPLGLHPFLGQWRAQIGYALTCSNEVGVWGTIRDHGDSQVIEPFLAVTRPVSQVNVFWHHNFESGSDSWLWLGVPEHEDLTGGGRLGEWTLGATLNVPLTERVAVYATGQYMRPTARAGDLAATEDAYTIGFGLVYFPGASARNRSVAGKCWMPYLPVANNATFLADNALRF